MTWTLYVHVSDIHQKAGFRVSLTVSKPTLAVFLYTILVNAPYNTLRLCARVEISAVVD